MNTFKNYSEKDELNIAIQNQEKPPSNILKLNEPQRKNSKDITNYGYVKKGLLEVHILERSEDDNDKYDENCAGPESSSDEDSITKKKRKLEKESSSQNTKTNVQLTAINNSDKIKKVNDRFVCVLCEKSFSSRKHCSRHISSIHLRAKMVSCEFCGTNFSRSDKLKDHIKRMHSANSVMQVQLQKNKQQSILYGNRLYSKPSKPWQLIQCKLCDESAFKNSRSLRSHLQLHKNKDTLQHINEQNEIVKNFFATNLNLDNIKDMICNDLIEQKLHKYYNIINDFSWEMSISDTEPEDVAEFEIPFDLQLKYECELCDMQFQFKYAAFEHQKIHTEAEDLIPFKCGVCQLEFISLKMYESHCQIHCRNTNKLLKCTHCPVKFAWSENMKKHQCALEKSERDQEKQLTERKTVEGGTGSQTPKLSSKKIIQCGLCCNTFEKLRPLRLHLGIHSDGTTEIDLKNSIYIKRFERFKTVNLTLMQLEIQNNFKRQQISRYYRALDKDGNEMDILDSETDDDDVESKETYTCTLCSTPADFKRRKDLLTHQHENHSNATLPFKCDKCAKQFISDCLLKQHLQRECGNEYRKRGQQCEHCEKRFIWPSNILKHKDIQHKQHGLKCDYCDKTFTSSTSLVRHCKIHIDGKTFACQHCKRKFQRKDNLLEHLRVHDSQMANKNTNKSNGKTSEQILPLLAKPNGCKIAKCIICYKEFNKICDLRSHLKSHQLEIDLARHIQDNEKISDISKLFYPDELPILAEEELQKKILHDIACDKNIERFYSITNEHGHEIHLDSSETESDSEETTESKEINSATIEKNNAKRNYSCDSCPNLTFTRKYQLFDHQLNVHKWKEALHYCTQCNARFLSSYLLQLHYKRQCKNSIKTFLCKQCPLRFMWKNNLETHITMDHASELQTEQNDSIHSAVLHYCLLCPMTFDNIQSLNEHLLEIHNLPESDIKFVESILHSLCWPNGEKEIECKLCLVKFQTMLELRKHQSISLKSKKKCRTVQHSVGNYSIVNSKGFELNLELDSETDNDDQEDGIEQHKAETVNTNLDSSKPYVCTLCNWSCRRKYQMMQHQRAYHDYNETLKLKCENCLFSSVCEKILDYHKQTQCFNFEKEFECHQCNFKFMWYENLENHILKLHGPSNSSKAETAEMQLSPTRLLFACMVCHRQYNRKDRYKAHFKKFNCIDDKVMPIVKQIKLEIEQPVIQKNVALKKEETTLLCSYCGMSFTNNSNLAIHMRKHTDERPYKCDLCEMAFRRCSNLQDHRRSHTGEKPYKCSSCDKSFSRSYKLQLHNRIHTGERPYHCNFCDKKFIQSSDLILHLRRHTGETPYLCVTCGKGFICSGALKQHETTKKHLSASAQKGDAPNTTTDYQPNFHWE